MAPPRLTRRRFIGASAGAAGLAMFGCAPGSPGSTPPVADGLAAALNRSAEATVNLGIEGGIPSLADIAMIGTTGRPELWGIAHSALAQFDHDGNLLPMLAERLPSVDDGTWVVNPDGAMQMTWHLRRNVKWHDGHPFTARDVRLSWEFPNDRALPLVFTRRPIHTNVTAVDVPDEHTVVMHWRVSNNYAHAMTWSDLMIYPDHIVRPLWESGDSDQILNAEQFRHGWIGLGPYRIDRWNPDDSIVFKAFDDYFLGRPKIGTVIVHQIESNQAVLTRLLAGELNMTGASALDFEGAFAAQEQWAARGEGKIWWTPTSLQRLVLPPSNPLFRDTRVRKALLHAIDRDEMVGELFRGSAVVGHSLLHPNEPGYRAADPVITKYRFDGREALALMEQAGWRRGSDGVLANAGGDRFEIGYRVSTSNQEALRVQGAVANYWREIGVRVNTENVGESVFRDTQEHVRYTGVSQRGTGTTVATLYRRWHSTFIPSAENRYTGDNVFLWSSPEADRLLEQLDRSFTPAEVEATVVQLARHFTEELPVLPIYYTPEAIAIHRNLTNARPRPNSSGQNGTTWSCFNWEWA